MKYLLLCLSCLVVLTGCQDPPATTENSAEVAPTTSPATTYTPAPSTPATNPKDTRDMDLKAILAHHNFVITSFNGKDFPPQTPDGKNRVSPNFDFGQWPQAGGRLCNNFTGQVEVKGNILTMTNTATTMMMCPEQELDELERAFHNLLSQGAEVEFKDRTLTLKGPDTILVYTVSDYL